LNPLKNPGGNPTSFSNGNLETTFAFGGVNFPVPMGTFGVSSGKWYWEITPTSGTSGSGGVGIGIGNSSVGPTTAGMLGVTAHGYVYIYNGNKYNNNSSSAYGASYTNNDVIGVALDCDNGTLVFYKNGASQGTAYTGLTSGPYFAAMGNAGDTTTCVCNFGQRAFAYTAPSGFKALCDTNLGDPLVAKPNTLMDVTLWTGDGASTRTISGLQFSPDFVWIKNRTTSGWQHVLYDTIRGPGTNSVVTSLSTDGTRSEASGNDANHGYLSSFTSDGFGLTKGSQAGGDYVNFNAWAYVAWTWDAGGTTDPSNTAGSITSQVRANVSAGFSVVTYTGNGSGGATFGHGLGVSPTFVIFKCRSQSYGWLTYHVSTGNSTILLLESTSAQITGRGDFLNSTTPSSTLITLGDTVGINQSGQTYVAYCFAPVSGYSSFGSYVGGSNPFVYLGFRPRFILFKATSAGNWDIYDSSRTPYNEANLTLSPNLSGAEYNAGAFGIDLLSNGFKLDGGQNASTTYIYAALAENPFQYARAR
jgi:hypothetical protein